MLILILLKIAVSYGYTNFPGELKEQILTEGQTNQYITRHR